jgi:peptidoglycan/LPS O-acetylase OafA/YrhL
MVRCSPSLLKAGCGLKSGPTCFRAVYEKPEIGLDVQSSLARLARMQLSTPQNSWATTRTREKIPQLDAVRGIAILIVMFHNYLPQLPSLPLQSLFRYGWMGVDLFFVLSGFLITGILFDTKQSAGYFKNFYARRCLRIWPLYYSVVFGMFVIIPLLSSSIGRMVSARSSPWWAYPIFLQNFLVDHSSNAVGPLGVTWSVAIEEQFYVVWAVVVRYCSYVQLRSIAVAVICLSPVLRFYLSLHQVNLYSNVFCRLDGLMAGGLIALAVRSDTFLPSRFLRSAWLSVFIAAPLVVAAQTFEAGWIMYSMSAVASAGCVYLAMFASQKWLQAALASRWLIYTGTISYGLYLLHKIPLDLAQLVHLNRHPFVTLVAGIAASYGLAILSWNLLEKPFLKLKRFFQSSALPQKQS